MTSAAGRPRIADAAGKTTIDDGTIGLADQMRNRTASLHRDAERSGIVAALLRGEADRRSYALFLRNLLPVYETMEKAFERHRTTPGVRRLVQPDVYRAKAIAGDLTVLIGDQWRDECPLLPDGMAYVARIDAAADDNGSGLIGHAYVRYLGDLNGGRILAQRLARMFGTEAARLGAHAFPAIDDLAAFRRDYRTAIDCAGREIGDVTPALIEADAAFRLSINLSEAVGAIGRA